MSFPKTYTSNIWYLPRHMAQEAAPLVVHPGHIAKGFPVLEIWQPFTELGAWSRGIFPGVVSTPKKPIRSHVCFSEVEV